MKADTIVLVQKDIINAKINKRLVFIILLILILHHEIIRNFNDIVTITILQVF